MSRCAASTPPTAASRAADKRGGRRARNYRRVLMKMSDIPSGPGARPNSSVRASHEGDGRVSLAALLTVEPRLAGADHGSPTDARVAP